MQELKYFTPIGMTNYRDQRQLFGIKAGDRMYGTYCLGLTGMGKSRLIINMAMDDIRKGNAVCVVDPHGDAALELQNSIPDERKGDMVYFDATGKTGLPAFNPLHDVPENLRQLVASELVAVFQKLFADVWGPKLEQIIRLCIISMLPYPDATLLDITAFLTDKEFRARVLSYTNDPYVLSFWEREYNMYTPSTQAAAILPILNKIRVLLANDTLRGIFGQRESISLDECMNGGKIFLVNLSKGEIGEDACTLLGSFLITAIHAAAMRRAALPESDRKPFYLFVDESHSFISHTFATMITQLRKYLCGVFLAGQYTDQFEPETKKAILGSIGSIITFKVNLTDAKLMEKEFHPIFKYHDFMSLPKYHVYLKLMIDGSTSRGFSAVTLP